MLMSHIVFVVLLFFVPLSLSMSRFSTKTPYIFTQQSIQNYSNFEPKKIWTIVRHGTRLPSKKVISRYNGLVELKEKLLINSKSLNFQQRAAFEKWAPMNIDLNHQKFLTKQGENEQFQLGTRFREKFSKFFDGSSSFTFKHTPTQRTELSAEKFIEGLFPGQEKLHQSTVVAADDPVLRPYKGCSLWRKTVKKNKEVSLKEKREFEESEHVANLVNEFREFTQTDLTIIDIEVIYTICGFETSWQYNLLNGKSTWCSLFQNVNQLRIMEYLEDLEYYWIDGPGFEVTRKVACKTVEDIFHQLE
jgi:multiple inositol-polyphosphate phosphatase / 2,3-bisphosphoglycerate 3-phosphatase